MQNRNLGVEQQQPTSVRMDAAEALTAEQSPVQAASGIATKTEEEILAEQFGMSVAAYRAMLQEVAHFRKMLIAGATQMSENQDHDLVSEVHIRETRRNLYRIPSDNRGSLEVNLGMLFLAGALGILITAISGQHVPMVLVVFGLVLGFLGIFFTVSGFKRP